MYCKICGTKNNAENTYCKNDGYLLENKSLNINMKSNESKFCSSCGNIRNLEDLYCSSCGISFYDDKKVSSKGKIGGIDIGSFKDLGDKFESIKIPKFDKTFNLGTVLYGFIGFLIIFICSGIFTNIVNSEITNMIFENFAGTTVGERFKFFNMLDTLLVMNVPRLKFVADILSESESLSFLVKGGLLGFLIIPIMSFIILGYIKGNDDLRSSKQINFFSFLTNGLVYAILILVISVIRRGESIIPMGIFDLSINLTREYGLINSFINSYVIYALGTLIGYSISIFLNKDNQLDDLSKDIFQGFRLFAFISVVIIIISIVFMVIKEDSNGIIGGVERIQLAGVILGLVNMGSYTNGYLDDSTVITMFSKDLSEIGLNGNYLVIFLLFTVFILGVFFLLGRKNKLRGNKRFYITPIVYSISMYVFLYLQNIKYVMSETYVTNLKDTYNMQGSIIGSLRVLIGALVITIAASLIGYLITNEVYEDEQD